MSVHTNVYYDSCYLLIIVLSEVTQRILNVILDFLKQPKCYETIHLRFIVDPREYFPPVELNRFILF